MSKKQNTARWSSKEMLGGGKHEHVCINVEIFLGLPNPRP